jgi:hypothetical protein
MQRHQGTYSSTVRVIDDQGLAVLDFWDPLAEAPRESLKSVARDFWQPANNGLGETNDAPTESDPNPSVHALDFWSLEDTPVTAILAEDWVEKVQLPWFKGGLQENPHVLDLAPPSAMSMAARRGRWLAQLLDIPEPRRRRVAAAFFGEVFLTYPSKNTFQALSDLAVEGVNSDAVINGSRFRLSFLDSPRLTLRRSFAGHSWSIHQANVVPTWRRCVRLSLVCSGDDPMSWLDDSWYEEWLSLDSKDGSFFSYFDFIEWRLRRQSDGYLDSVTFDAGEERNNKRTGFNRMTPSLANLTFGIKDQIGLVYPDNISLNNISRGRHEY